MDVVEVCDSTVHRCICIGNDPAYGPNQGTPKVTHSLWPDCTLSRPEHPRVPPVHAVQNAVTRNLAQMACAIFGQPAGDPVCSSPKALEECILVPSLVWRLARPNTARAPSWGGTDGLT